MTVEHDKMQQFQDDYKSAIATDSSMLYNETNRTISRDLGNRVEFNDWHQLMTAINNYAYRMRGAGSCDNSYQLVFSGFDKYGYNQIAPNAILSGYTFITRPKLNLGKGSVRHDTSLGLLETTEKGSPLYAIRCMLDTKYCESISDDDMSPYVDKKSPFLKLLTNCTRSHSGWQDFNADTYTTEGGYFNEDQTAFLGFDDLNRTYDLSIEFTDIQGGHVMALFYYWFLYMFKLKRGSVFAYAEDINARRLCYTCSIYRFLMDPSKQIIVGWAKATGCFPKSVPIGALFNINSGELHVSSAQRFSIPFAANKIEYNKPEILTDFNVVSKRFCKGLGSEDNLIAPITEPSYNYIGRPLVSIENGRNRLMWYYEPDEEPRDPSMIIGTTDSKMTNQGIPIESNASNANSAENTFKQNSGFA